ncbi:MAG: hypothetical protein RR547_01355 [Raoultibacter sp.]
MSAKQSVKRKSVKTAKSSSTGSSASASKKRQKKKRGARKHHWLRWIILLLLLVVAVILGAFSWDRWFRYDDVESIQGEWKASGETAVVVIDGKQIHLTDEVAYDYTLNTWDKTIEFSFGKLSNNGTYEFSEDRKTLVIVEGGKPDLVGDFLETFGLATENGAADDLPTTSLIKLSNKTDVNPQVMKEEPSSSTATDPGTTSSGDAAADGSSNSSGEGANDVEGDTGSLFDTITDRSGPA